MLIPGRIYPWHNPTTGGFKLEGTTLSIYLGKDICGTGWIELSKANSAFILIEAALAEVGWDAKDVIEIMKTIIPRE